MKEFILSVIIITYNRPHYLSETIESVLFQSITPSELIVVDNSSDLTAKELVSNYASKCKITEIRYFYNNTGNSSARARNFGADQSTGNILLFLDDDIILDEHYIENILHVYDSKPEAKCVVGVITNEEYSPSVYWTYFKRLFLLWHYSDISTVLPSGKNTRGVNLDKVVNCQWASGCNISVRRSVFDLIEFDGNLEKYSFGDDMDFTYRIYTTFVNGVFQTPHAKLFHKWPQVSDFSSLEKIKMEKMYTTYFIFKNLHPYNYFYYLWSELGLFVQKIIFILKSPSYFKLLDLYYHLYANCLCIFNLRNILCQNLTPINNKYFNNDI